MTGSGIVATRKTRAFILAGTALGCTLGVAPAVMAQNVTYNGPGPYTLTQTTPVSGGPRAIDVTVTSDDAVVDTTATTVDSVNNGNGSGVGIGVNNTGPGNVTVRSGNVTASGSGPTNGIDVRATTGTITIANGGTVSASGNNADNGIVARSGGGNVVVNSNVVSGQRFGIIVTGNGGTFGTTGTTSITSANATANGTGLANAIVAQGNRVVLNSGTASNANAGGVQGTAIFVNTGAGGALVNAGTTTAFGQNQSAIQVFSSGAVDVTSGSIRTTQTSDGLSIASGTDVVVRSTNIVTEGSGGARGIVLGGNAGGGGFNSGPNGFAYTSAVVTSGSITTAGNGAYGIYATPNGAGSTIINSNQLTTTGANATGILVTAIGAGTISGSTTINNTGALRTSGNNAIGIQVAGGTGAVTIANSGSVAVAAASTDAIRVQNGAGPTTVTSNQVDVGTGTGINVFAEGAVAVTSGTIARTGTALGGTGIAVFGGFNTGTLPTSVTVASDTITGMAFGINANSRGDASVTSGTMALTTAAAGNGNGLNGFGLFLNGVGNTTVNSGSLTFTGSGNAAGIQVQNGSTTGGALTINSGTVSTIGNGAYGILAAASGNAAITINSTGPVSTTGTIRNPGGQTGIANTRFSDGITAYSQAGSVSITNAGAINTSGNAARGIAVETGRAIQSFGAPAATASTAAITITNSGSITTRGNSVLIGNFAYGANGIFVSADSNPITIASNAVATSGNNATGIQTRAGPGVASTGPVTIDSTTITTTGGGNSLGIIVSAHDGLTIRSGSITTNGSGLATGINATAAATSTATTNITSGLIDIRGTAGGSSGILVSPGGGATVINSDVILNAGTGTGIGVQGGAISLTGDITINSRDITMIGLPTTGFRTAMNILPTAGTLTINSTGTIQSNGAGIVVQTQREGQPVGAVNITSNVIDAFQSAIIANSGSAVTINAATTSTSGDNQAAIVIAPAVSGPVTINAANLTTTGARALGVSVNTGNTAATAITIGTASTTGSAVDARTAGALTVTSGTARVAGSTFTGLTAISRGGDVTVNSTDLAVANGTGIFAQGLDNTTVTSGTLAVTGNAQGIFAQTSFGQNAGTAAGTVTVTSTNLTSEAGGINAAGPRAAVVVNSGTLTAGNAQGIGAFGGVSSTVNSGTLTSQGAGIFASFDNTGDTLGLSTINSDSVFINGGTDATTVAVSANNRSVVINSGSIVSTGLGNRIGIAAQAIGGPEEPGDVTITSRDITTVGNGAYGIQAIASAGAVTINSTGLITTTGTTRLAGSQPRYSAGIVAVAQNGPIAVTSNDITTSGAESDGVRVEAGAGIASFGQGTIGVAPIAVTTTGQTRTAGVNASGINVLGGGGAVTIANTGTIATTGDGGFGINVAPRDGATAINSATVGTTGAGARGIRVVGTTGAATLTAQTVTTTGLDANAIDLRTGGAVMVDVSAASAAQGVGTLVQSGGLATVRAGTVSGGGAGGAGLSVTGGTGVVLTVANAASTGAAATDANGVTARADAILAEATNGAISATIGSASATGQGADAIRLTANGTDGAVTARVTGTVASTSGYGLFIDPPGAVVVDVAAGASIAGALAGIDTAGGSNTITNAGTIRSTGGAAIVAAGPTAIDNSGTLAGAGGVAVLLGAADDSVTLRTGSSVTGNIVGGGGTDAAFLIGTGTVPVATQLVAGFTGFERLTVQSGYWTAPAATASTVARTIVNGGAALEVQNGAAGIAGYATGTITDNGLLVVRSSAASAGSTFGATALTGTGNVTFTGAGTTTLDGTNTLANTGTNLIEDGRVLVTGTQGGNFATANGGTLQIGTGGTTGTFTGNLANNGTLIVNRSNDAAFAGALTGAGLFVKEGAGRITFGTGYAFTGTTQLNGGAIRLTGPVAATTELDLRGTGQIDFSGTNQTVAELQGNSPAASVNIAGGSLTVNQATSTTFAGALVGTGGSLTKAGTGTLNLTGASTYTGPTTINGGRLLVNGSIVSPVTVNAGGTLGGTGTVGATTVASGGTWAPGNSIGTQTVNGNVTFAAGSIYQVEANAAGAADRINATGITTLSGGTVQVLAESGTYARQTNYTILTALGGVNGRFANVTSNFAFLTPVLGYGTGAVTLTLARNDLAFGALATTGNQLATANALFARGPNDPLFNAVLFQSVADAPTTFTELSGELNAALPTELTDNSRRVRQAVLDRGAVAGEGLGLWVDGLQSTGVSDATPARARLKTNRTGVVGGVDYSVGNIRFGGFGGYQDGDVRLRGRGSSADVKSTYAGVHVGFAGGPLSVQLGGLYAWHDVDTSRALVVSGFGPLSGRTDATSKQLFGEVAYALTQGEVAVSPFVRNAYTWTRVDAFTETGGSGALAVDRVRRDVGLASAGVRVTGTAPIGGATFLPRMSIAYERGYGDRDGVATQRFGGTGPAFSVTGAGFGKDGLAVDGGFDIAIGAFSAGVGGFASTSNRWSDYGGKATLGIRF